MGRVRGQRQAIVVGGEWHGAGVENSRGLGLVALSLALATRAASRAQCEAAQ